MRPSCWHSCCIFYFCVGFVNFVLHQSLGIDYAPAASGAGGFVTPGGIKATSYFSAIDISGDKISAAQPGDILISSSHVAIMVADGQVVDCIDSNGGRDNYDTSGNAVKIRSIASESGWATYTTAARLVSVDGVNFSPIDGGIFVPDVFLLISDSNTRLVSNLVYTFWGIFFSFFIVSIETSFVTLDRKSVV